MKKSILLIMGLFIIGLIQAQVGIKTQTPYIGSAFHIDAMGNNASSTSVSAAMAKDDVLIDADGNMGIGTVTPAYRLEVIAGAAEKFIRLDDGTNFSTPKILISDDNGVGTWQDRAGALYVGNRNLAGMPASYATTAYTGKSLTLTKGRWIIRYSFTWQVSFGASSVGYINTYVSTSASVLNVIPGSYALLAVPYDSKVAYSHTLAIFDVTAASQTIYLWTLMNGALTSATTYDILSGIPTNIFEAFRW